MHEDQAEDGADAAVKFRRLLGRRTPGRLQARIYSPAGMAALCEVEAVLISLWPIEVAKEFIWLTRTSGALQERLHMRAFGEDGEMLCEAAFHLAGGIDGGGGVTRGGGRSGAGASPS